MMKRLNSSRVYRKILTGFFLLNILTSVSFAQSGFIFRGQVLDADTKEPAIGANIVEYDDQNRIVNATIADINGFYSLKVSGPDVTVSVTYIGYEKQEFKLNGRTQVDVQLKSSATGLAELTVTAQSTGDPLTGVSERNSATSRVKIEMLESNTMGVTSADEALQGRVSGVDITAVSGNPGSGASIVIRGLGSLGNSQPLIVVDGIKQNIGSGSDFDFASADEEDLGSLVNIAPQDIKSIEVLKDAASTAVWGSEGADGVLLIETFKGSKGKTKFFYNSKLTLNLQPDPVPMLSGDEYIMLQLEEWHNARGIFDLSPEIAYDRDYFDFYNYTANTDWIGEITKPGFTNDQFFKLEGGGDKTLYYASVSYLNDLGTLKNTDFERITTRLNLDYNISRKLRFTMMFNYTNSNKGDNFYNSNQLRAMAYRKSPNMSIMEYDPNGVLTGEYFTPIQTYQGNGINFYNPVAVTDLSLNDIETNEIANQFVLNYTINKWLRFRETIAFNYKNEKNQRFLPSSAVGATWINANNNRAQENNVNFNKITTRSQLFFTPRISSMHVINGSLMWETSQISSEATNVISNRGPNISIQDPSANTVIQNISTRFNENRSVGALFNLNYTMMDKYIFQANMRIDGSSKFGIAQRWGMFPSVSAAWRFSNENFLKDQIILSDGKLRVSYGESGKQPKNPYDRHAIYNTMNPNLYIDDPIIIPTQVQLDNLKWQTVTSLTVGVDLSFLKDRFNATFEVYDKVTSDLLWEDNDKFQLPSSSGYAELKAYNAGSVQNKGWEFFINGMVFEKDQHKVNMNFNISRNVNTFLEFPDNFENEKDISIGNGDYPRRADEGVPVGSFYGFRYQGVWPTDASVVALNANGNPILDVYGNPVPLNYNGVYNFKGGDAKYADINNDGKIDILDVVYLGDSNPDFIGGFGINYSYKNFDLRTQFFYRTGYQIVNELASRTEGMLNRDNQSKAVLRRWRAQGQNQPDILPRAYYLHPANNLGSDRYVENGDFLRLNNVSIGYKVGRETVKKMNLKMLQISVNMRKLLTITKYSGQDPEVSQKGSDPFWFGTDNARTPPSRVFTLSINVGF